MEETRKIDRLISLCVVSVWILLGIHLYLNFILNNIVLSWIPILLQFVILFIQVRLIKKKRDIIKNRNNRLYQVNGIINFIKSNDGVNDNKN